jgi:hypothetical protein
MIVDTNVDLTLMTGGRAQSCTGVMSGVARSFTQKSGCHTSKTYLNSTSSANRFVFINHTTFSRESDSATQIFLKPCRAVLQFCRASCSDDSPRPNLLNEVGLA